MRSQRSEEKNAFLWKSRKKELFLELVLYYNQNIDDNIFFKHINMQI